MYREYTDLICTVAVEQENPVRYKSIVTEAIKNEPAMRARLVDILYQDIAKRKNLSFDVIPNTHGDITKMPSYDTFLQAIDSLGQITVNEKKGIVADTVRLVNELHNKIIIRRNDFEYGYKVHVDLLQVSYCTAVSSLYQLMNICILAVSNTVTSPMTLAQSFTKVIDKNDYIYKTAVNLNRALDDKNWKEVIKPIRNNTSNWLGMGKLKSAIGAPIASVGLLFSGAVMMATIAGNGLVAALSAVREGVFGLYVKKGQVADWAANQKALIDFAVEQNPTLADDKMTQKASKSLDYIAGKLDRELSRANKEAKEEMKAESKDTFSHENISRRPIIPVAPQDEPSGPRTSDSDVMVF